MSESGRFFDGDPWDVRRLRVVRMRDLGVSQKEIAARLGISASRVHQIEQRGRLLVRREREINHAAVAALELLDWCRDRRSRLTYVLAMVGLFAEVGR